MTNSSPFCTCTDHACPMNPVNHDRGCSLCIAKCLKEDEIPSCFFKKIDNEHKPKDYKFLDFAAWVESHK